MPPAIYFVIYKLISHTLQHLILTLRVTRILGGLMVDPVHMGRAGIWAPGHYFVRDLLVLALNRVTLC